MNAEHLLAHFDRLADAPDAIPRLRRFILDLAVRGKLVEQDPNDEPVGELLEVISSTREEMIKAGQVKRPKKLPPLMASEVLYDIPRSWSWVRANELWDFENGDRGKNYPSRDQLVENGIPFINAGHLISGRVSMSQMNFITPEKYRRLNGGKFRKGDQIYCLRGSLGKHAIYDHEGEGAVASSLVILRPIEQRCVPYLFIYLESHVAEQMLQRFDNGSAQPNLSSANLRKYEIPLPPLAEQHRIVAKVDELMALCDRLETSRKEREATCDRLTAASLARLNTPAPDLAVFQNHATFALNNLTPLTTRSDQIKVLRQTILNLAVRGKLVEQNPEDEPAGGLLKRIAAEKMKLTKKKQLRAQRPLPPLSEGDVSLAIPTGWQWVRLGDVLKLWSGFAFKSEDFQSQGIPVIRIGDLQAGKVDLSNTVCVSEDIANSVEQEFWIPPHALLIAMSGATTGKVAFNKTGKKLLLNQRVGRIETFLINVNFVRFFFDTIVARNLEISFGTAIPNLSAKQVNETIIPLPPLAEQHRIVVKVDKLMALCDRLEAGLARGEETRGRLVDSLLHGALEHSSSTIEFGH